MNLSIRSNAPELMDNPNFETNQYAAAYADIGRCNQLLGGNTITLNAIYSLVKTKKSKNITILDVGCGDGAMLRAVAHFFENKNIKSSLTGIDIKDDIIDLAKQKPKGTPTLALKSKTYLITRQQPNLT